MYLLLLLVTAAAMMEHFMMYGLTTWSMPGETCYTYFTVIHVMRCVWRCCGVVYKLHLSWATNVPPMTSSRCTPHWLYGQHVCNRSCTFTPSRCIFVWCMVNLRRCAFSYSKACVKVMYSASVPVWTRWLPLFLIMHVKHMVCLLSQMWCYLFTRFCPWCYRRMICYALPHAKSLRLQCKVTPRR